MTRDIFLLTFILYCVCGPQYHQHGLQEMSTTYLEYYINLLKLGLIGKLKLATLTYAMLSNLVLCLCILVCITKIIKGTRVCMMTKALLEDTLMVMCALRRHASSLLRRRHHAAFCPLIIIVAGYMVHQT